MPKAMKVCARPGCPELVPAGTRRCDGCKRQAQQVYDAGRPSAARRGYDDRWRRTRAGFLRLQPMCSASGCLQPATEVDHIDGQGPLGPRGHDVTNLRGFCKPHHSRRTAVDQSGWGHVGVTPGRTA